MKKRVFITALILLSALLSGCIEKRQDEDMVMKTKKPDIIGSTHVRGRYYLTDEDFLNEGADQLLEMGTRVIKVWLHNGTETPAVMYPYNTNWPKFDSLVACAEHPYWKELFNKPFTTYIIQVMAMTDHQDDYYWLDGFEEKELENITKQMYDLAKYLLKEYQNTDKTFIFSNHETDWHLKKANKFEVETPVHVLDNAVKWFTARQAGVNKARNEIGMKGVRVFHCGEVVNVVKSMKEGQMNMVNYVLPKVKLDLISYSAWDSTVIGGLHEREEIGQALDYIAENAIDSEYFGNKNVFIGEYGIPENEWGQEAMMTVTKNVVETGLEWGCPYIVYWQLYCNEPKKGVEIPSWELDDFRGFWLIRPDGSKTDVYNYFKHILKNE